MKWRHKLLKSHEAIFRLSSDVFRLSSDFWRGIYRLSTEDSTRIHQPQSSDNHPTLHASGHFLLHKNGFVLVAQKGKCYRESIKSERRPSVLSEYEANQLVGYNGFGELYYAWPKSEKFLLF
jgi:hypothetical protein